MSEDPKQPDVGTAARAAGSALAVLGRALPISRGAMFYTTLVLVLVLFVAKSNHDTSKTLARTDGGICAVFAGAAKSQAQTVSRLEASEARAQRLEVSARRIENVWKFVVRQSHGNRQSRRLGERLVHGWETQAEVQAQTVRELKAETAQAKKQHFTFPGCPS